MVCPSLSLPKFLLTPLYKICWRLNAETLVKPCFCEQWTCCEQIFAVLKFPSSSSPSSFLMRNELLRSWIGSSKSIPYTIIIWSACALSRQSLGKDWIYAIKTLNQNRSKEGFITYETWIGILLLSIYTSSRT